MPSSPGAARCCTYRAPVSGVGFSQPEPPSNQGFADLVLTIG
jgi:hypothetical protein